MNTRTDFPFETRKNQATLTNAYDYAKQLIGKDGTVRKIRVYRTRDRHPEYVIRFGTEPGPVNCDYATVYIRNDDGTWPTS